MNGLRKSSTKICFQPQRKVEARQVRSLPAALQLAYLPVASSRTDL
jgi:hypothetical protein